MLDTEDWPREQYEPHREHEIRSHRAARLRKLRELDSALGEVTDESPLYHAVEAMRDIIEDILDKNFV